MIIGLHILISPISLRYSSAHEWENLKPGFNAKLSLSYHESIISLDLFVSLNNKRPPMAVVIFYSEITEDQRKINSE